MQNPYQLIRLQNGLTQEELARFSKLSINTLSNSEQGLYLQPPPAHTYAVAQLDLASHPNPVEFAKPPAVDPSRSLPTPRQLRSLSDQWSNWQYDTRKQNTIQIRQQINLALTNPTPATWFEFRNRVSTSLYGFAKLLTFDIRTLQFYDSDRSHGAPLFECLEQVLDHETVYKIRQLP